MVVVRPGLFAVVGEGRDPERFQPMPDLVSTKMAPDAVVSHHSALDFLGDLVIRCGSTPCTRQLIRRRRWLSGPCAIGVSNSHSGSIDSQGTSTSGW